MQQQKSLKIYVSVAIALLALVWLIWSNLGQSSQAETIEKDQKPQPVGVKASVVQPIPERNLPNQQYQQDFASAVALLSANDQRAESAFRRLIQQNPQVIEAYINLSSILAEQGKIWESTDILMQGLKANPTTATAFDNLQQLHGALAAQAYQQALVETAKQAPVKPEMKISSVAYLGSQSVSNQQSQQDIAELQRQLTEVRKNYELQIADLNHQLKSKQVDSNSTIEPKQVTSNQNVEVIEKVKSWAKAWSDQKVNDYIAHYQTGYRPADGVSNSVWQQQRRIRLTNKKFIKVGVSNFSVKPENNRMVVTFTQHYQSNTMDDSVRKRLVFVAPQGDWAKAKIVAEQVER